MDYNINYEDEKFKTVEAEKEAALSNVNNTYNSMIGQSDKYYQDQINAVKDYSNTQQDIQQANTDFAIEQVNQQKEQAGKDYKKEQAGAYQDYQKQSDQFGANAEQMAAQGLANTGFSETSQVSMYNQYQNRVMSARDTFNRAVLNYDNAIKEAQLANNSKLAEIAYNTLQTQLELSLQGFQYKNNLLQTQLEQQQQTEDRYYARWQNVLNQMNTENQFAESIRQYEQNYELQQEQFAEQKRQFKVEYDQRIKEYKEEIRQFDVNIAYLKDKDAKENALKIKQLEEEKRQAQIAQAQWEKEYSLKQQQVNQAQSNWEKEYALAKQKSSSGGGGGGGAVITKSSEPKTTIKTSDIQGPVQQKNTSKFTTVSNSARTLYNATRLSSPTRAKAALETFVAQSIANKSITTAQASTILSQILGSSSGGGSGGGGFR